MTLLAAALQVNNASGGVYNFTSYQQLQDVAGESAGTLGAAAVTAYSTAVSDDGVISLVAPQFDAPTSATLDGVILVGGSLLQRRHVCVCVGWALPAGGLACAPAGC